MTNDFFMKINKNKAIIFMFLASVCLGTIWVLIKKIDGSIPTMTISFLRVFIAFLFLLPILPFVDKTTFKPKKWDIKQYAIVGVLIAVASGLFNSAFLFAPVQNVVIINYIYPFIVMIFAWFMLKEKITKIKLISAFIAIIWLIIINPFQLDANMLWNFLALGAGTSMALLVTKQRQVDKIHSIGSVLWYLFFASLALSPAVFIWGFGEIGEVWIYVFVLWIVSTGMAYLCFNLALEKLEAEVGSIIAMTTTPIVSIILAVLLIGESLNIRTVIGGVILISAGFYLQLSSHKRKK